MAFSSPLSLKMTLLLDWTVSVGQTLPDKMIGSFSFHIQMSLVCQDFHICASLSVGCVQAFCTNRDVWGSEIENVFVKILPKKNKKNSKVKINNKKMFIHH